MRYDMLAAGGKETRWQTSGETRRGTARLCRWFEDTNPYLSSLRTQGPIRRGPSVRRKYQTSSIRLAPGVMGSCVRRDDEQSSLRRRVSFIAGFARAAAHHEAERQSADRENRDQFLDADGANHLEAGGQQHRIGQHV